jgi:hypothetical protein
MVCIGSALVADVHNAFLAALEFFYAKSFIDFMNLVWDVLSGIEGKWSVKKNKSLTSR